MKNKKTLFLFVAGIGAITRIRAKSIGLAPATKKKHCFIVFSLFTALLLFFIVFYCFIHYLQHFATLGVKMLNVFSFLQYKMQQSHGFAHPDVQSLRHLQVLGVQDATVTRFCILGCPSPQPPPGSVPNLSGWFQIQKQIMFFHCLHYLQHFYCVLFIFFIFYVIYSTS